MLKIASDFELPPEAVTETFAVLAKRGGGKALALDTPIPTPAGWATMGTLRVGDEVFDDMGQPCQITATHNVRHGRPCYRVRFADGAAIIADGEHLWRTETLLSRLADQNAKHYATRGRGGRPQCERWRVPALATTEEIAATLRYGKRGDLNHAVAVAKPLDLPVRSLPVDPYVLGVWLGDGTGVAAVITTADDGVLDEIRRAGYRVGKGYQYNPLHCPQYRIHEGPEGMTLHAHLRSLGLFGDKHVPEPYLRAAAAQRLALLQGLMDADGWAEKGQAVIGLRDERLADAVHELVVSLGWKAWRRKRPAILNGVEHGISHIVEFRPDVAPFRLARKCAAWRPLGAQASRQRRRMIVAVEPVPSVPVRCIAVDSSSRLFLAGRDMVPTHNTYLASVMAEEMGAAGYRFVVLDPIGVWWGLRSSADGKHGGLPVVIFGGDHGDVPLEATAGTLLADIVVDEGLSVVLDLSAFRKAEQARFVADFAERLYRRNRDPLHLFVDEADAFCPQRPMPGEQRMLGAMEDLVRRGRARGVGVTLVTQRSAAINKAVLSQCEVLVALRTTHPRDRDAIDEWIKVHGEPERRDELMSSLAGLPIGTAWVWSAGWLDVFQRIKVRRRTTFDSSATPKVGEKRPTPKRLASVDLAAIHDRIQATIERAKAEDPRALRAEVAELRRQLERAKAVPEVREVRVEVPAFANGEAAHLARTLDELSGVAMKIYTASEHLERALARVGQTLPVDQATDLLGALRESIVEAERRPRHRRSLDGRRGSLPAVSATQPPDQAPEGDTSLKAGARRMLEVLGRHHPVRVTRSQLGTLSGFAPRGGTFSTYLSTLKRFGYVDELEGLVGITDAGFDRLGFRPAAPESTEEIVEMWRGALKAGARAMLDELVAAHPEGLTRAELGDTAGFAPAGGTFGTYLSILRRNGLAAERDGVVYAGEALFLDSGRR